VTFASLNLAADAYPSLTNNTNAMDVIFCRNVLMYFTSEQAKAVVEKFYHSLVDGGWLIVSPAETSTNLFSRFTTVEFSGAILYRKDTRAEAPRFVNNVPDLAMDSIRESWRVEEEASPAAEPIPEPAKTISSATEGSDDAASIPANRDQPGRIARECANLGRLSEAVDWCRKAIAADKLNPAHHYLLSAIQQELGQGDDAVQSLRRALYLDPDFVLAHYALGNLRNLQGRWREGQRHFENALATLRVHPPNEIIPESDGLTAGRLMEIIVSMQSGMPQRTANL